MNSYVNIFVPRIMFFMVLCRILSLCLRMGKWKKYNYNILDDKKSIKKLHVYGNRQTHAKESMTWLSKES